MRSTWVLWAARWALGTCGRGQAGVLRGRGCVGVAMRSALFTPTERWFPTSCRLSPSGNRLCPQHPPRAGRGTWLRDGGGGRSTSPCPVLTFIKGTGRRRGTASRERPLDELAFSPLRRGGLLVSCSICCRTFPLHSVCQTATFSCSHPRVHSATAWTRPWGTN